MNLEQLRGFVTIARVGHFTHAAEVLHLSQPSLSRQISTLEHDLGATLLNRTRGNLTLTAAGHALLPLATRMLADEESIRVEMAELAGLRRGRVRLGAPPTLCASLVAEVLETYHAQFPGIELQISEAGSRLLLEQLTGGQLDLALIVTSEHAVTEPSLAHTELLVEQLVVADSVQHPQLADGPVDLRDLARVPQITFSPSYDLRAATHKAYQALELTPNVVIDGGEMDAVLRFVQVGLGAAIVPATALVGRPEVQAKELRASPAKDPRQVQPSLERTIGLAHRRDTPPGAAASAMHQLLVQTAGQLAQRHAQISLRS